MISFVKNVTAVLKGLLFILDGTKKGCTTAMLVLTRRKLSTNPVRPTPINLPRSLNVVWLRR